MRLVDCMTCLGHPMLDEVRSWFPTWAPQRRNGLVHQVVHKIWGGLVEYEMLCDFDEKGRRHDR